MGCMELCRIMDQYESLYSDLYACKLIDWRRHELVAGNTHYIFRKYNCINTDDPERPCRGEIWNTLPGFCKGKFWYKRRKHSCHTPRYCCMWLVWYTGM